MTNNDWLEDAEKENNFFYKANGYFYLKTGQKKTGFAGFIMTGRFGAIPAPSRSTGTVNYCQLKEIVCAVRIL